ncbi:MAG: hypothetical protein ACW99G_17045 [Candidatus Thorarchaeota archaeon]|jgi:uncharacterized membrane protein
METLDFIVVLLAAYRLSDMVADPFQEGPFGIFIALRDLAGVYFDEYSNAQGRNNFARGLLCQYCNSVWIGILFTLVILALLWVGIPVWIVFLPLGISGFITLIKELSDV